MKPIRHLVLVWATVIAMSIASTAQSVFINEFTYDYEGPETKEFIEIFGPAGTDLTDWTITLYNGINGIPYHSETLAKDSGIKQACTLEDNKYGVFLLPLEGDMLKNDIPVGIALANPQKEIQHFISYEGHVFAKEGLAEGLTSQDVGVSQNDDVDMETTIQLNGTWQLKKGSPQACNEKQQPSLPLDCHIVIEALDCTGEKVRLSVAGQFETYQWSTGQTSTTIEVGVGDYTVDVSTKAGEKCQSTISVKTWTVLSCEIKPIHPSCEGEKDGELHVTSEGGSGHVEYSLDGENFQVSPIFTDLPVGDYTVTIKDKNGPDCTTKCQAALGQELSCNVEVLNHVSCGETADASIEVIVTDNTTTLEYSIDGEHFQTSPIFSKLEAGVYTITINNPNDETCSSTCEVTILNTPAPTCNVVVTDATCEGSSDGSLEVMATGGHAPYEYQLENGAFQTTPTFSGLVAGAYTVRVREQGNADCMRSCVVVVGAAPSPIEVSATETLQAANVDLDDGIAQISISGGVPPYMLSWAGRTTGESTLSVEGNININNLFPGIYQLKVQDNNECITVINFQITSITPYVCFGETTTIGTDFNESYCYHWMPNIGNEHEIEVSPTETTTYELIVTDNEGNIISQADFVVAVVGDNLLEVNISPEAPSLCPGEPVSLSTVPNDFVGYMWSNGANTPDILIMEGGLYSVTVTDEFGCEAINSIELEEIQEVVSILAEPEEIDPGEITTLTASGNGIFSWNTGETGAVITVSPQETTTYQVIRTSESGCISIAEVTITVDVCFDFPEITGVKTFINENREITVSWDVIPGATHYWFDIWSMGNEQRLDPRPEYHIEGDRVIVEINQSTSGVGLNTNPDNLNFILNHTNPNGYPYEYGYEIKARCSENQYSVFTSRTNGFQYNNQQICSGQTARLGTGMDDDNYEFSLTAIDPAIFSFEWSCESNCDFLDNITNLSGVEATPDETTIYKVKRTYSHPISNTPVIDEALVHVKVLTRDDFSSQVAFDQECRCRLLAVDKTPPSGCIREIEHGQVLHLVREYDTNMEYSEPDHIDGADIFVETSTGPHDWQVHDPKWYYKDDLINFNLNEETDEEFIQKYGNELIYEEGPGVRQELANSQGITQGVINSAGNTTSTELPFQGKITSTTNPSHESYHSYTEMSFYDSHPEIPRNVQTVTTQVHDKEKVENQLFANDFNSKFPPDECILLKPILNIITDEGYSNITPFTSPTSSHPVLATRAQSMLFFIKYLAWSTYGADSFDFLDEVSNYLGLDEISDYLGFDIDEFIANQLPSTTINGLANTLGKMEEQNKEINCSPEFTRSKDAIIETIAAPLVGSPNQMYQTSATFQLPSIAGSLVFALKPRATIETDVIIEYNENLEVLDKSQGYSIRENRNKASGEIKLNKDLFDIELSTDGINAFKSYIVDQLPSPSGSNIWLEDLCERLDEAIAESPNVVISYGFKTGANYDAEFFINPANNLPYLKLDIGPFYFDRIEYSIEIPGGAVTNVEVFDVQSIWNEVIHLEVPLNIKNINFSDLYFGLAH